MSKQIKKPLALALGATLIGGLSLSASAFAMSDLSQGYLLGAQQAPPAAEKAADAKTATGAKHAEGTCGADKKAGKEGSCGADKKAGKEGSCGADKKAGKEGSCGADKKKHAEGKCGEGKCGADKKAKKAGEGKCGEGKCGGSI